MPEADQDAEWEVEDPYEPLQFHLPGTLQQLPMKHRLPSKRTLRKVRIEGRGCL